MIYENPLLDHLYLLGLNHRVAHIELREKLFFHPDHVSRALEELRNLSPKDCTEISLLSTCNRTEIIAFSQTAAILHEILIGFLADHANISSKELAAHCYEYRGLEAADHLLRVSAGLDSLVIGESEILGQVRRAFMAAQRVGTSNAGLSAIFRSALHTGKRVRSETQIGKMSLSVASVVVELATENLGDLKDRTALLVGAGKISTLTARALSDAGLRCILVSNRTFNRAQRLADSLHGQAVHFDQMPDRLVEADIVISSTGAPHFVLHAEAVSKAMGARHKRPLLIADLAVPRDVDPLVREIKNVHLVHIDDLDRLVQSRHPLASATRQRIEEIIAEELDCLQVWFDGRRYAALICGLQERVNAIVETQVEITSRKLGDLTPDQQHLLEIMGRAIASQLLHEPIRRLKNCHDNIQGEQLESLASELFGIN